MQGLGQDSFEHMHPFIFDQINAFSGAVLGTISAQRAISGMLPLPDAHITHEDSPRVLPGYPKFEVDTGHGSSLVAVRSPIAEL